MLGDFKFNCIDSWSLYSYFSDKLVIYNRNIIKAGTVNMHNQMMIHYLMANKLLYNIPIGPQPLRIQQYAYIKATA